MTTVQAFPGAAGALGDVGLFGALVMHLEVLVGAAAKEFRAARPEVGEPGDELLGRRGGRLVEADRGHACSLLGVTALFAVAPNIMSLLAVNSRNHGQHSVRVSRR